MANAEKLRFPGLSPATRAFFRALDSVPCPTSWPGADRVAYVANVLSPLKALVVDLDRELDGSKPELVLEPRVGQSLAWPREVAPDSADCPVRCIRAWTKSGSPTESPLLTVTFFGRAIELGLEAAGSGSEGSARIREAILDADDHARSVALALVSQGWRVEGPRGPDLRPMDPDRWAGVSVEDPPDEPDEAVPDDLRPFFEHSELRMVRRLAWEPWLEEPSFALEVADHFRELLPLLALMTVPDPEQIPVDEARTS